MWITNEDLLELYPVQIREKYILIECENTIGENIIGTYNTEMEAYRDLKKVGGKTTRVFKSNVRYLITEKFPILYDYEEVLHN